MFCMLNYFASFYIVLIPVVIFVLPVLIGIVFQLLCWIFLLIASFFFSMKKDYQKPSAFSRWLLNFGYRLVCSGGRLVIHFDGKELLPKGRRFLFISNHRSRFDHMVECLAMDDEYMAFVSKEENFRILLARRLMKRNCYISLKRGDGRSAFEMIRKSIAFIKNGVLSIGIFPEGTRSPDGKLLPFKPGVFKIAEKSECPIVVGAIKGTDLVCKNWPWKRTPVHFEILKVYEPCEFKDRNTNDLSDEIENLLRKSLES